MDQNSSSNPVTQAPAAPVSSDTPAADSASVSASDVPVAPVDVVDTTSAAPESTTAPDSPIVTPDPITPQDATTTDDVYTPDPDIQAEVVKKISEAQNVLVALSSDPSVDEMAAAIGLSIYLDKLGKRATAIYSGSTPNALEFLKPEETFESTTDALQDFVIALNKEKADHLRYKLDGDYVKIFITPYKSRIGEEDLDFSYGDFNVDLVLALDVSNGIDLDAALREHGRIMHDAVIINITTGNPGRFGEIEWNDKTASSISEMIASLLYNTSSKVEIDQEEATAFLTGIVAATDRFSNAKTTPETMKISSRLMQSGANQQLISKNITPDIENEFYSIADSSAKRSNDPTKLDIEHEHINHNEKDNEEEETKEHKEIDASISDHDADSNLLDDLKAAEVSLATAGSETVPDTSHQPIRLDSNVADATTNIADETSSNTVDTANDTPGISVAPTAPLEPILPPVITPDLNTESISNDDSESSLLNPDSEESSTPKEETLSSDNGSEKIIQPPSGMNLSIPDEGTEKYGKMLEDAISGAGNAQTPSSTTMAGFNPASMMAPSVASTPEINGVPEMNYMPMPGEEVLPPPPAPPIDVSTPVTENPISPVDPATATTPIESAEPITPIQPATPPAESTPAPLGPQPAMQDQVYAPQASDPGAFRIPGM